MAKLRGSCFRGLRILALVLMIVGTLLLVFNLPGWIWGSVLGIAFLSAGLLIWRFL